MQRNTLRVLDHVWQAPFGRRSACRHSKRGVRRRTHLVFSSCSVRRVWSRLAFRMKAAATSSTASYLVRQRSAGCMRLRIVQVDDAAAAEAAALAPGPGLHRALVLPGGGCDRAAGHAERRVGCSRGQQVPVGACAPLLSRVSPCVTTAWCFMCLCLSVCSALRMEAVMRKVPFTVKLLPAGY